MHCGVMGCGQALGHRMRTCLSGIAVQRCAGITPPPLSCPTPCLSPGGGGLGDRHLVKTKFFYYGSLCCCVGDCVVRHCHLYPLYPWHSCTCQASYQKGQTTTQECCPKHSSGKW